MIYVDLDCYPLSSHIEWDKLWQNTRNDSVPQSCMLYNIAVDSSINDLIFPRISNPNYDHIDSDGVSVISTLMTGDIRLTNKQVSDGRKTFRHHKKKIKKMVGPMISNTSNSIPAARLHNFLSEVKKYHG